MSEYIDRDQSFDEVILQIYPNTFIDRLLKDATSKVIQVAQYLSNVTW